MEEYSGEKSRYPKFSVLMSLYIKEKSQYARACFESLLQQTIPASEWIIVEDGPLRDRKNIFAGYKSIFILCGIYFRKFGTER